MIEVVGNIFLQIDVSAQCVIQKYACALLCEEARGGVRKYAN